MISLYPYMCLLIQTSSKNTIVFLSNHESVLLFSSFQITFLSNICGCLPLSLSNFKLRMKSDSFQSPVLSQWWWYLGCRLPLLCMTELYIEKVTTCMLNMLVI